MAEWYEEDHPRDEKGRFAGGMTSYGTKMSLHASSDAAAQSARNLYDNAVGYAQAKASGNEKAAKEYKRKGIEAKKELANLDVKRNSLDATVSHYGITGLSRGQHTNDNSPIRRMLKRYGPDDDGPPDGTISDRMLHGP